jgi:hypothetical protein
MKGGSQLREITPDSPQCVVICTLGCVLVCAGDTGIPVLDAVGISISAGEDFVD